MPVLKDDVIKSLTFIRIPDRQKATLDELSILVTHFPIVIPQEDITQLEAEFIKYQCTSEKELPSYLNKNKISNRIAFIWNGIAKINDACTLKQNLIEISVINTTFKRESIFSTVKKICTDDKHNLDKNTTEGHASTSVYQSITGIRNNLFGLSITKVNIFLRQGF